MHAKAMPRHSSPRATSVRDLRSNPLLLSLMCILYRGEGSLPRNRAECLRAVRQTYYSAGGMRAAASTRIFALAT